jgi:O-methyltransferase
MLRRLIQTAFNKLGYELRKHPKAQMPVELSRVECDIIDYVMDKQLTMVSYERLWTTLMACKHAIEQDIPGDFVECGVWRGGNAMVAAELFKLHGLAKKVWLFDTFKGMTAPTAADVEAAGGKSAQQQFAADQRATHNAWCYASLGDVRNSFVKKGLMSDQVLFVEGDVCQTLADPAHVPDQICVLRLDTDWYESTRKELEVLYPKLSRGGCLIIDDYGHWAGSKKATDEYFAIHGNRPFLQYTDVTGRVAVKVA